LIGRPPFETSEIKKTYKLIKTGQYSFPDDIPISKAAQNLVDRLIQLRPSDRVSLTDILKHPFLTEDGPIPTFLPLSTIACPPSGNFLRQYSISARKLNQSFKMAKNGTAIGTVFDASLSGLNRNISRASGDDLPPPNKTSLLNEKGLVDPVTLVERHLDVSVKYGYGYTLTNGDVGVYFNDRTSLIHPKGSEFAHQIHLLRIQGSHRRLQPEGLQNIWV
jgi:polo-like kinase 1